MSVSWSWAYFISFLNVLSLNIFLLVSSQIYSVESSKHLKSLYCFIAVKWRFSVILRSKFIARILCFKTRAFSIRNNFSNVLSIYLNVWATSNSLKWKYCYQFISWNMDFFFAPLNFSSLWPKLDFQYSFEAAPSILHVATFLCFHLEKK